MSKQDINIIIQHLRFPFSLYLMPVYLFALNRPDHVPLFPAILLFFILHFLAYPSSNGYNSYMDQDEGSIGGIEKPQKVPRQMFHVTLLLDALALTLTFIFFTMPTFALLVAYILASRAYSYRGIRLKKFPIVGFLTVAFFQGAGVYLMSLYALNEPVAMNAHTLSGFMISLLLISAGYPLTQIYQHKQDKEDNVTTISMILGIRGTFLFSGFLFAVLGVMLFAYQYYYGNGFYGMFMFVIFTSPVVIFFTKWMMEAFKDHDKANFANTMRMNNLGALCLNTYFITQLIGTYN